MLNGLSNLLIGRPLAAWTLLTLGAAWSAPGAAEPPFLYRQVAAKHGLAGDELYREALRFSGRRSRYGQAPAPWPWTVRGCAGERCETVHPTSRAAMTAVLTAGQAAGLTLYVGPLGLRWDAAGLPLRAATSPRVTLNEAARQWARTVQPAPGARAAPALPQSTAARRARYQSLIDTIALGEGLDPDLVHAVITAESHYNPVAASPKGAVGLMQLMPATAERFGLPRGERTDPERNLRAGARYLRWLLGYFQGQVHLAVAAYNAGEGAVEQHGGIPPYRETRQYVPTVLGYYQHYRRQRQTGALLARSP